MRLPYNEESENKLTPFELDLLKEEEQRKSMQRLSDFTQGKLPFEASHPLPNEETVAPEASLMDIQINPDNKEVVIDESLVKAPKATAPKLAPEKQALVKKLVESPNTSPEVKQQLNKYLLEGYSAEDRKAISDSGNEFTDRLPAMLAALGAGIGKRDPVAAASTLDKMRVDDRNQRLKDFDTEKAMKQAELDSKSMKDPLSERSYAAQTVLIEEYGVNPDTARKMTAELIESRLPHIKARMDREFREKQLQSQREDRALQREMMQNTKNQARQDKLEKEAKLSDKQLADLATHDSAIKALDDVIEQKKKWDTGKLSMGMNKVAGMVGLDDAEKSAFKSSVGEQLAQYIKSISGATVSPTERAALLENVPSVYDNDDTFEAKAQALKKRLGRNRQVELDTLEKGGKNTSAFKSEKQPMSSKIKVSNGKETFEIDESDLADAEKDGYHRI